MYGLGHLSSSAGSKCIICNKVTSTYLSISDYSEKSEKKVNASIEIPVCDGEHYSLVATQKEILIGYAKTINKTIKALKKE